MYIIDCHNITKFYQKLQVLKGINFQVKQGQFLSILGASGAGKSTLLNIIGTLDRADSGKLYLFGQDLTDKSSSNLNVIRNRDIGFIFQFHHLLPEFTALENASMPGYIAKRNTKEVHEDAKELLCRLGLEERMHHKPGELSGGEQQRVALARALINKPKLLLADEPTGNLDHSNAEQIIQLILELKADYNMTAIIVTHDKEIAQKTDQSYFMKDGLIL